MPLFSKPSGTRGGLFWAKPSRGLRLGFQTTMVPASQRMSNQSPAVSTCEIWNRLDVYIYKSVVLQYDMACPKMEYSYIYSIYTHTAKMQCEKIREIENLGQPGETGETGET